MAAVIMPEHPILDFRAPPPSPIASGRRSSVANDEFLTQFLETSLKVPDLVLPDKVFPRQVLVQNPPKLDFRSLESMDTESSHEILDSVASIGCFEVVNHGIPSDLIRSVLSAGGGVFWIPPEMKAKATRSPEKFWGFEEVQAEEEMEGSEEFVWCKDDHAFNKEMEGIWPLGYSNFREKVERLSNEVGEISGKILEFLEKKGSFQICRKLLIQENKHDEEGNTICYLNKQWRPKTDDEISLKYEVIRILIRGCEFPHALCVHFTNGSSNFNLYSKKDWVSFQPHDDALIFTIGDKFQAWSGGRYKHVIGRAVFQEEKEGCISMAILYSPPEIKKEKENTISFGQQIIIVMLLILICQFLSFILNKYKIWRRHTHAQALHGVSFSF